MNIRYDKDADAAYIHLAPATPGIAVRTYNCDQSAVSGIINLDFNAAGQLVGIEILDASKLLPSDALRNC